MKLVKQPTKKAAWVTAVALVAAFLLPGTPLFALEEAAEESESNQDVYFEPVEQFPAEEQPAEEETNTRQESTKQEATGSPEASTTDNGDTVIVPPAVTYTMVYDPQPTSEQDVLDILEENRMPCWQYPVEESLLPKGFVLKEVALEFTPLYYSVEFVQRGAQTRLVGSAAGLREAFADLVDGDVIMLTTSIEIGALASSDGSSAALSIPSGIHITLCADENGPYRLYRRDGGRHFALQGVEESSLTFENIVLQGLHAEGDGRLVYSGGIEMDECREVAIYGAQITGAAAAAGGAVKITGSTDILLQNTSLTGNAAQNGGALYADESTLTLQGVAMEDNTAGWGGGLYLHGASAAVDESSTLRGNTAYTDEANTTAQGGGARLENGAHLALQGTAVENNTALAEKGDSMGGGLAVCGSSTLVAEGITVEGNVAQAARGLAYGGGIYLGNGNTTSALGETAIQDNSADVGGGVYLNEGAALALGQNSPALLGGNSATKGGGALCVYENASLALGEALELEENQAEEGEDVYLYGTATLQVENENLLVGETIVTAQATLQATEQPVVQPQTQGMLASGADTVPFVGEAAPATVVFIPMELAPATQDTAGEWSIPNLVLLLGSTLLAMTILLGFAPTRRRRPPKPYGKSKRWARRFVGTTGVLAVLGSQALYLLAALHAPVQVSVYTFALLGLLVLQLACVGLLRLGRAPKATSTK